MVGVMVHMLLLLGCESAEEEEAHIIPGTVHTIINTECEAYFTYQCMAFIYAFKRSGQPGNLTRVMNCSPEKLANFSKEDMEIIPTFLAPQASYNNITKDSYAPFNRPAGIMYWLEHAKPREEWIIIADPDTYFRRPMVPNQLQIQEGWVLGTHYNYLAGVNNKLAENHIPEAPKRSDNYAGPVDRKADQVGCFLFIRQKDLKKLAPLWYQFSADVREDTEAWNLTGQVTKKGVKPWISEMYGLAYGLADLGLKGVMDPTLQVYPQYLVADLPHIVHYGLNHSVLNFWFDKHAHFHFDSFQCPPWKQEGKDGGLFPHPPFPHEVPKTDMSMKTRYGELLVIEAANTLNQALCDRHKQKCEPSEELSRECSIADAIGVELMEEMAKIDRSICSDFPDWDCKRLAQAGDCITRYVSMSYTCRQSCGFCYGCNFLTTFDNSSDTAQNDPGSNRRYSLDKQDMALNHEEEAGPFTVEKQLRLLCLDKSKPEMSRNPKCALFTPQKLHYSGDTVLICSEFKEEKKQDQVLHSDTQPKLPQESMRIDQIWIFGYVSLALVFVLILWASRKRRTVRK